MGEVFADEVLTLSQVPAGSCGRLNWLTPVATNLPLRVHTRMVAPGALMSKTPVEPV